MSSSPNPRVLADEEFVSVQPALIRALDGKVVDALVLQYLYWWQRISQNELDGHYWVYNTYEEWSDRLGISPDQFKRTILRLEEQGLVISRKPNAGQWKHRKWYRVDTDHEFWETLKLVSNEGETPVVTDRAIPPDRSGDSAHSRSGDFAQSTYTQRGHTESTSLPPEVTASLEKPKEPQEQEPGTITDRLGVTDSPAPASPPSAIITPPLDGNPVSGAEEHGATGNSTGRPSPDDDPSPEVLILCGLLADLYHDLGNKRPNPNQKSWYRECRLLMTKDGADEKGYTFKQIETIIRWALADSFWKTNIRSMPKLRAQFDTLRMRRNEEIEKKKSKPSSTMDLLNEREKALA